MIVNRLKALPLLGMLAIGLAACANPSNTPSNAPLAQPAGQASYAKSDARIGKTAVIVALSGGGARSAAFGYGVLSALAEQPAPEGGGRTLADDIAVVAGVSGGGMLAAYVALHGPSAIPDFKRDFLDRDPEASLRTAITPVNLLRGYRGGVNDLEGLAGWLDEHLYHGATLGDLQSSGGPRLLLHATDLYNRAPFPFEPASFQAICSDFSAFPLSHAVAASAAVPVLFAPVVVENYNAACPAGANRPVPAGVEAGIRDVWTRYATASDLRYLKLLDGGLVDNLATRHLIAAMREPAPAPLSAEQARRVTRVVVVVADASTRIGGDMSKAPDGPGALDTVTASIDAMIDNASRASLDTLEQETRRWRQRVIRWRCDVAGLRDCDRFEVELVKLSLADIRDPATAARILQAHNRLSLTTGEVDLLSGLGRRLLAAGLRHGRGTARQ
uniref:Patatin-like phospholipase family protein n=1 Tax=Bosea sp. NBC_00436 TaxID=2969620 RepID=A0A9E7ZVH0_9HYPH